MDAIYLVLGGESKGPYPLAQVREMLARGEISRETSAWHEGAANWAPLGSFLDQAGAAAVPGIPAPPIPAATAPVGGVGAPGLFSRAELRDIAKSQNLLMWSVVAGIVAFFVAHIPLLGIPIVLAIVVFQIYALYLLGTALRLPFVWLWCLSMFIPCVSLLVLVFISGRASRVLKAAGVRVGLMGGNADDLKD